MFLYHYYDKKVGPFRKLTDLSAEDAKEVLAKIKVNKPDSMAAQRDLSYVDKRLNCERILREEFDKKGGKRELNSPHYMTLEHSPWLNTWFEDCGVIRIPVEEFDLRTLSFTYADSMPAFSPRVNDGKEYRHRLYTYEEILRIIEKYDLPQNWNDDGKYGPERYIEVQIWTDDVIKKYL
ncbi:MAG: hypothetical protein MJ166_00075 [Clostridia bacterium]|nr:hypothetical protein [Clostridia bacterium]